MKPKTRARIIDSLQCLYQSIGHDVWHGRTPTPEELMDVLCGHLADHVHDCEQCAMGQFSDMREFQKMSRLERNQMAEEIL